MRPSGRCGPVVFIGSPWWRFQIATASASRGFDWPSCATGSAATTGSSWPFCRGPSSLSCRYRPASCTSSSCLRGRSSWWHASPSAATTFTRVCTSRPSRTGRGGGGCPSTCRPALRPRSCRRLRSRLSSGRWRCSPRTAYSRCPTSTSACSAPVRDSSFRCCDSGCTATVTRGGWWSATD